MKPQNSKTSQRKLKAAQNREKVVELRLAGYKLSTISKQVGISIARCSKIISEEIQLYNKKTAEDIGLYRAIQNDRLERGVKDALAGREFGINASNRPSAKSFKTAGRFIGIGRTGQNCPNQHRRDRNGL